MVSQESRKSICGIAKGFVLRTKKQETSLTLHENDDDDDDDDYDHSLIGEGF
jgi:hypothetical protein